MYKYIKEVKNEEKQVFFWDFMYNKVNLLAIQTNMLHDTPRKT